MSSGHVSRMGWREPLDARARLGVLEFRRGWLVTVGAGAALTLFGFALLALWALNSGELFNLRAAALACGAGLLVTFLLVVNDFIPRTIQLGEREIRIEKPEQPQRVPYEALQLCVLTTGPNPLFRGLGAATEPLFELLWNPDVDFESIRTFLSARGVRFSEAPPDPSLRRTPDR